MIECVVLALCVCNVICLFHEFCEGKEIDFLFHIYLGYILQRHQGRDLTVDHNLSVFLLLVVHP